MDYSKVAPPSQNPADHNTAFADALARARQVSNNPWYFGFLKTLKNEVEKVYLLLILCSKF